MSDAQPDAHPDAHPDAQQESHDDVLRVSSHANVEEQTDQKLQTFEESRDTTAAEVVRLAAASTVPDDGIISSPPPGIEERREEFSTILCDDSQLESSSNAAVLPSTSCGPSATSELMPNAAVMTNGAAKKQLPVASGIASRSGTNSRPPTASHPAARRSGAKGTSTPELAVSSASCEGGTLQPTPSYRISSATSRSSTSNSIAPATRTTTPKHAQRSHHMPLVDFLSLQEVLDQAPPFSEPTPPAGVSSDFAELVVMCSAQLDAVAQSLKRMARHDTQRTRELLQTTTVFLSTLLLASDCSARSDDNGPSKSTPSLRELCNRVSTFLGPPTLAQVTASSDGSALDIARVSQDGCQRITMTTVPLNYALCAAELDNKLSALQSARDALAAHFMQPLHAPERKPPAADSPTQHATVETAAGSPVRAAAALSKNNQISSDGESMRRFSSALSSPALLQLAATYRRAAIDTALAQEHRALVQCFIDLNKSHISKTAAAARRGSTGPVVSTPNKAAEPLCDMQEKLKRSIDDVDRQLRSLRSTSSLVAATAAFKAARLVTVDKEDVLLRERQVARAALDILEAAAAEARHHTYLVEQERKLFATSAMSLKSTAEGRDDEIAQQMAALGVLRHRFEASQAENKELKTMLRTLLSHVVHLEERIESSKRLPPEPTRASSTVFSFASDSPSCDARLQGSPGAQHGAGSSAGDVSTCNALRSTSPSYLAQLRAEGLAPSTSSPGRPATAPANSFAPSMDAYRLSPNLSMPRKLSPSQQAKLSARLHDASVDLRRAVFQASSPQSPQRRKGSASRAATPQRTCTRLHQLPDIGPMVGERRACRNGDDEEEEECVGPSVEELNLRLFVNRKDARAQSREKLLEKILQAEANAEQLRPLKLRSKRLDSPGAEAEIAEKFFRKDVQDREAARARLFEDLVLSKEIVYSPKKVEAGVLTTIIDRLYGGGK